MTDDEADESGFPSELEQVVIGQTPDTSPVSHRQHSERIHVESGDEDVDWFRRRSDDGEEMAEERQSIVAYD